ncbi:hypothetical protein B7494_g5806 [Chlorociboria aeruginascens]|nr:hypothetical protein B7494_g5806 [Chlorociboria aeruginascens]
MAASHGQTRRRLVIAIDSGTTRCEVAYALLANSSVLSRASKDVDVQIFVDWAGYNEDGELYPSTTLYYEVEGELPITGFALRPIFQNPNPGALVISRVFRLWKLLFHNQNDPAIKQIQKRLHLQLGLLNKTRQDLIRDWVEAIYQELIANGSGNPAKLRATFGDEVDLEIVVPVPPGRSAIEHDLVRRAFIQGPIKSSQVSLVSEPEAMFRSWIQDDGIVDWKIGQVFIVLDAGGGTACLVRFRLVRLNPLLFKQEFMSESIICGAETISDRFALLAGNVVHQSTPNRAWVIDQMRREFDANYKHSFGGNRVDRPYVTKVPGAQDRTVEFPFEQIAACFTPCVQMLVDGTHRQIDNGGNVDVGRTLFLTRLHAPFIISRPIKASIGIFTWERVVNEIRTHPSYRLGELQTGFDGMEDIEFVQVVQWLAKKGEQAEDRHEIASEATFKSARRRTFEKTDVDPTFRDHLVMFDYHPGNARYTLVDRNNKLVDESGNHFPDPIGTDIIEWKPKDMGVAITGLQEIRRNNRATYRVLHYSIQMQMSEVGTKYWIKAWSLKNKRPESATAVLSKPVEFRSLFTQDAISENLDHSFKLGPAIFPSETSSDHIPSSKPPSDPKKLKPRGFLAPIREKPSRKIPVIQDEGSLSPIPDTVSNLQNGRGFSAPSTSMLTGLQAPLTQKRSGVEDTRRSHTQSLETDINNGGSRSNGDFVAAISAAPIFQCPD